MDNFSGRLSKMAYQVADEHPAGAAAAVATPKNADANQQKEDARG
jgi:hypothetical protein